tara:strand:+ start:904 stop:1293 length:390 start_codon:yes stop_codon:yes gene_type:complete
LYILAAVFVDDISLRELEGSVSRIDLTGVQFSAVVEDDFPIMFAPHLAILVHSNDSSTDTSVLEVTYYRDDEQIARNVQPLNIEAGKFAYRLVRAEMEFVEPGTIEARCRIGESDPLVVPYTLKAMDIN